MPILICALSSLAVAWLRGASPLQLGSVRLRLLALPVVGFLIQVVAFVHLGGATAGFAVWLQLISGAALLAFVLANLRYRALGLVALGTLLNLAVILANGGYMPVRAADLERAGFPQLVAHLQRDGHYQKSTLLTDATHLPWLADVIYLPLPYGPGRMISVGDVFVAAGTFLFVQEALAPARRRRAAPTPGLVARAAS